jgi:Leucine-rich repeat (LRR) protein/tRNA A-37 threonylcarbamoyl transferase component Bud32
MNERSPAEDIFFAALEKAAPAERAAYLEQACAGNEPLRRRVEALLAAHPQVGRFLERPVAEAEGLTEIGGVEDSTADLSFLAPPTEPGSLGRLDHYEILEVVGRGGMGVVLRARDTKLLRAVALKALAGPLAASGTARRRFAREARAAAAVRDVHVVAIHAVCDDGPVPYLVMEFIDGCSLDTLVRRGGPLEVQEVLRIGIQVASGLAAAHQQGLIHRDVKPANILLENGVQRVKLTDFGLARAADDASLTQSGIVAGTPLYMSPEQAAGEPLGPRADLFSLGSVLYEMCTGRPAFRAPSTMAVMKRVCEDTPRPIREASPDVPEALCALIDRLHAKNPADRPGSAQEVADRLAGVLAELTCGRSRLPDETSTVPGPARQAGSTERRTGPSRRWLWVAVAPTLLFVGLGLGEATGVTNFRGTALRLFSPDGTLVVEVDDPAVSVTIDSEDFVITGAGAKEIRLKPGQYKVRASKDGKVVQQELVTVARNGRQVVRISKEAAPAMDAERWEKSVAGLPAEKQVEAVARRLQERNPGFDGKVTPTIEHGTVRGLGFSTANVADLSPLRALRGLNSLDCSGPFPREGKLSDLGPLRGLPLTSLICGGNPIADLSPLRGMPLKHLACGSTRVSDLTPLKGMRLERLVLVSTRAKDLAPLQGMPLTELNLDGLREVSDLSPLKGMPLERLSLRNVPVSDLSPLAEIKSLRELTFHTTNVADLSPLRELRGLNSLDCSGEWPNEGRLSDLGPLHGLPLTSLLCGANPIADLSPLRGMPLKRLGCGSTHVSDLTPLKDMPLEELALMDTRTADLAPLQGIPLHRLSLDGLREVSDLSPLKGMPLEYLSLRGIRDSDLSPIKAMPLKSLGIDYRADREELLRSLTGLEVINDKPAAEFWKEAERK